MQTKMRFKLRLREGAGLGHIRQLQTCIADHGFVSIHMAESILAIVGEARGHDDSRIAEISGFPNVLDITPVYHPFALTSHEFVDGSSTVAIGKTALIGGRSIAVLAGPRLIGPQLNTIANDLRALKANVLTADAVIGDAGPYDCAGFREDALKMLREAGDTHGLPVMSEVADVRQVPLYAEYVDLLAVGERNTKNVELLKELGSVKRAVLVTRGPGCTIEELLVSAEHVLTQGNASVILCESGVLSFGDSASRILDVGGVASIKRQSHLPIVVNPCRTTMNPELVAPLALAAAAAGADGIIVELTARTATQTASRSASLSIEACSRLIPKLHQIADARRSCH